jgi:hypothetical protein
MQNLIQIPIWAIYHLKIIKVTSTTLFHISKEIFRKKVDRLKKKYVRITQFHQQKENLIQEELGIDSKQNNFLTKRKKVNFSKFLNKGTLLGLTGPKASLKTFFSLWLGIDWLINTFHSEGQNKLLFINIFDEVNSPMLLSICQNLIKSNNSDILIESLIK